MYQPFDSDSFYIRLYMIFIFKIFLLNFTSSEPLVYNLSPKDIIYEYIPYWQLHECDLC